MSIKILALGNRYRQDDGVGPWIAEHLHKAGLAVLEVGDDLTRLVEGFAEADEAIVVEAVVSGHPAGTIHVLEVGKQPLPSVLERSSRRFPRTPTSLELVNDRFGVTRPEMGVSSHSFDLAEAIELARTLGSLPEYTVIYGIEGQRFGSGEELSPEVVRAAEAVIQIIMARSGHPGTSPQTADRP